MSWYSVTPSHASHVGLTAGTAGPLHSPLKRVPAGHVLVHAAHTVSELAVAAAVWYSVGAHSVTVLHVDCPA